MAKQYLHVGFKFADGGSRVAQLEPVFNKAIDWFRYAPNCWIVWTSSSAEKWYERLKPHLASGDNVFIVAIDLNERQGWMQKSFWDWVRKERTTGD